MQLDYSGIYVNVYYLFNIIFKYLFEKRYVNSNFVQAGAPEIRIERIICLYRFLFSTELLQFLKME